MQRVNSVLEKENPADTAAGLSRESDQAVWYSGDEFIAAIRVIIQARCAIQNVMEYSRIIDRGRPLSDFDQQERSYVAENLRNAETVYREMYRSQVRTAFTETFGVFDEQFEDAILTLQRALGGE